MKTFLKCYFLVLGILELSVFLFSIYKMMLGDYPNYWGLLFLGFLSIILIHGIYYMIKNWRKL